ncbi:MAG: GxxExxY protein [Pseudomonadota bacterium]|nr:GxxExxY protein [Pseudomonadota bacterium]
MDANFPDTPGAGLSRRVIGAFYRTYNELGHGFLESVYENALALEMDFEGLQWERQAPIDVRFRDKVVGVFRADFIVERQLIVEIKAVDTLMPAHDAQVLNYLKATGIRLGLLLNFGPRAQVHRRVF